MDEGLEEITKSTSAIPNSICWTGNGLYYTFLAAWMLGGASLIANELREGSRMVEATLPAIIAAYVATPFAIQAGMRRLAQSTSDFFYQTNHSE